MNWSMHSAAPLIEPEILELWDNSDSRQKPQARLHGSYKWLSHRLAVRQNIQGVIAINRFQNELPSVLPLVISTHELPLIFQGRTLSNLNLRVVELLGEGVCGFETSSEQNLNSFFQTALRAFPEADAIVIPAVRMNSAFWSYLATTPYIKENFSIYLPNGISPYHVVKLPDTYEEYTLLFGRKCRYNLRREARLLSTKTGAEPELVEYSKLVDVAPLSVDLMKIMEHNTKYLAYVPDNLGSRKRLDDLASRGLLKSFVLKYDSRPIAAIVGVLFDGIYHLDLSLFDADFQQYSPGNVLFQLVIQTLITQKIATEIQVGFSKLICGYPSGLASTKSATMILLKKTMPNRAKVLLHQAFVCSREIFRAFVKGKAPTRNEQAPKWGLKGL